LDLKVGQSLNLEIIKTGTAPEFRLLPGAHILPEAKIAEFVKQFLPRHEAAPIFLNQLIKDLPQLLNNESVPQTLKDIAVKIVQNLPQKEQLISSQSLKQAIINSGLFLEAKLPMAQAELIIALPRLIKNESVPQSLQRIAAEILQSLTQNKPMFKDPGLEHAPPNSKSLAETQLASLKLNMPENPVEGAGASKAGALGAEDFKANLLKFIQALKQELSHQNEQHTIQGDLDLLKNLQNKTENSVAKIVLDQLMSLPKEDNPKQLWIIDIPFMDRQQAETVKIEIQRDKENKRQSGSNDWSVNITITPPELGTIHCMVSYRNDVINTYFKSQNHRTTELIQRNLDYLKNQLEESGLKTGQMDAHVGTQKAQAPHQLAGKKLFDDNA
jgi:flagellar hook-length control protein FliK